MQLGRNLLQFVAPRLLDGEYERNEEAAELAVPAYIRRAARERALEWTSAQPKQLGFRHVRLPGAEQFTIVQVAENDRGELIFGMPACDWTPVAGADVEWGTRSIQEPR